MIEEIRDIQTRAGEMETFIVHPDRNGPHPSWTPPASARNSTT